MTDPSSTPSNPPDPAGASHTPPPPHDVVVGDIVRLRHGGRWELARWMGNNTIAVLHPRDVPEGTTVYQIVFRWDAPVVRKVRTHVHAPDLVSAEDLAADRARLTAPPVPPTEAERAAILEPLQRIMDSVFPDHPAAQERRRGR
jgi:hypothetical protein